MTKADDGSVRGLEVILNRLDMKRERIDQSLAQLKSERQQLAEEINRTRQALEKRRRVPAEPSVSAHALLRFVERILGVDVGLIERQILSPANVAAIKAGASRITVDGIGLVIKNQVVVTVVER